MLRISRLTDYGIVLLAHLATDGRSRTHNARELSEHAGLPLPVVSKILKQLTHEGILVSHRGAKGGYGLARTADEISVTEIIGALEGPIALTECTLGPGHCDQEVSCLLRTPWQRINQAVHSALSRVTLADLAQPPSRDWLPFAELDDPLPGRDLGLQKQS
jgi:FeS assembly SUF system regulator